MAKHTASQQGGYGASSSGTGPAPPATSFLNPIIGKRDMKCITVSKIELKHLSMWGGLASFLFGLATMCWGFAFGIYQSYVNADPKLITPEGKVLHATDEPILFWLGIFFLIGAILVAFCCANTISHIEGEMRKD
jgi:hypothetical protein